MTAPAPRPSRPAARPSDADRRERHLTPGAHPDRPQRVAVGHGGEVITAVMVEQRITRLSDELEALTGDLARFAHAAAEAEVTYKAKYAKCRMVARNGEGHGPGGRVSNDEADDRALGECEVELRAHLIAGAVYASARDAMFTKGRQLEALRTIAANIRAQT